MSGDRKSDSQEEIGLNASIRELHEVGGILQFLERRYGIRLPDVEVRYSENISHSFCITATELPFLSPLGVRSFFVEKRISRLRLEGLKDEELKDIPLSKFTIFIPQIYLNHPSKIRGALWHELGHATANSLNIKSEILSESIAIACQFTGLLRESQIGVFSLKEALDKIELDIETANSPWSFLSHYREALGPLRLYNSGLKFRDRNPGELLTELDQSIQYAVKVDRETRLRELSEVERPFVMISIIVAAVLLIASVSLHLL